MWILRIFGILFSVLLAVSTPARAQTEGEISSLISDVNRLRQAGKYGEAIGPAKKLLDISEKTFGPDHPNVGTSLNNLAELYRLQGRYAEAEPLYKRTITIREKALGPDHPDVGQSLNNQALLYGAQGRYAEAEPLYKRTITIWEKALGPDHRYRIDTAR